MKSCISRDFCETFLQSFVYCAINACWTTMLRTIKMHDLMIDVAVDIHWASEGVCVCVWGGGGGGEGEVGRG